MSFKSFAILMMVGICALPVHATIINLSTHVSGGINPPSADLLDATLDFSVVDST